MNIDLVLAVYDHLGESTVILGASGVILNLLSIFRRNSSNGYSSAASHLGLYCLLNAHKKDSRLTWVEMFSIIAQNIDCGYTQGGSNEYPQTMVQCIKNTKMYTFPCTSHFIIWKWRVKVNCRNKPLVKGS